MITALQHLEDVNAEELMPMILSAWYDRTTFMEGGRKKGSKNSMDKEELS